MSDELDCPIHAWAKRFAGVSPVNVPPVPRSVREPDCFRCSICTLAIAFQKLTQQRSWDLADDAFRELTNQVWAVYGRETKPRGPVGRPRKQAGPRTATSPP